MQKIIFLLLFITMCFNISQAQTPTIDNSPINNGLISPHNYTSEQDSAFFQAKRLKIPPEIRFEYDLHATTFKWYIEKEIKKGVPLNRILTDLEQKFPNIYMPNPVDIVLYQTNLINSMYVPYTRNSMNLGNGGGISFETIGKFLGVIEDTSPNINYELSIVSEVQVVVYNISGVVIAILANEVQQLGQYHYYWNGTNELGITQAKGDYIIEVRISNSRYIRKSVKIK